MKGLTLLSVLIIVLTNLMYSQSVDVKDSDSHTLIQINDEGTTGSIGIPSGSTPDPLINKLYNEGGTLKWNGNILGSGGSSLWTLGTSGLIYYDEGNVAINRPSTETPLGVHATTQFDPGDFNDSRKGSIMLTMAGGTQGLNNYGPAIAFSGINSGRRRAAISAVQTSSDADQIGLAFFTYPSPNTAYDNVSQTMVITHIGDVGVGTSTPAARLDVNGSVILGESGTQFLEIIEITGSSWDGDNSLIAYPSGYDENNIRVLSYYIYEAGSGGSWSSEFHHSVGSSGINIYYEDASKFHYQQVRIIAMKMP